MTALLAFEDAERPVPRALEAPTAVLRSGRRAARAAMFLLDVARTVRHDFEPPLPFGGGLRRRAHRLSWIAENLCTVHGIAVERVGEVPRGPAVLVANHLGYLDPLAIAAATPCLPIAKRELASWPLMGDTMRRLGVLMVNRGSAHDGARVLLQARRYVAAGLGVLAFPEGTTTRGDRVLPLRRGVFGLAQMMDAPVVPIAIRYAPGVPPWVDDQLFLPHYLRTAGRSVTRVRIHFGDPIEPSPEVDAATLAETTRRRLASMLEERP